MVASRCLKWITNMKSWVSIDLYHFSMTLSDLERQDARGPIFHADLHTVWPTVIKFGLLTHVGRNMLIGVSHASNLSDWPRTFGTSTQAHIAWPRTTKFSMISHMREGRISRGPSTFPTWELVSSASEFYGILPRSMPFELWQNSA